MERALTLGLLGRVAGTVGAASGLGPCGGGSDGAGVGWMASGGPANGTPSRPRYREQHDAPHTERPNTMTSREPQKGTRRCVSFDSFDEYEAWHDQNPNGLEPPDRTAEDRFWEVADLSDAMATLNPYEQEYFVASFDSFDEYEAWKNGQANPWNW